MAILGPRGRAYPRVNPSRSGAVGSPRDAEVFAVGEDHAVITFVDDGETEVTTRFGEACARTIGPHHVACFSGLTPGGEYAVTVEGHAGEEPHLPDRVQTLERPSGALLATIATVNDVHFGEDVCGVIYGTPEHELGPWVRSLPGEDPYPLTMNRGAVAEMAALGPDAVVVKGDLTCRGTEAEYQEFLDTYSGFGDRLHHVRGNHDAMIDPTMALQGAPYAVNVNGVTLAVLDTVQPGLPGGTLSAAAAGWLDETAGATSGPVLVFGHHNIWDLNAAERSRNYFGIDPDGSERLAGVVARRENIVGYFAGHTHRHRIRRFDQARTVPFVEVGCVKDYPGVWAEYRVYEGGYTQVVHRISSPAALTWTERTRNLYAGIYRDYALGTLDHRCFGDTF